MQKARLLTDEKSVSFQLFLRLLSSITLCSEKPNSRVQRRSEQYLKVCFCFVCLCGKEGGGGGSMRRSQNLEIVVFSVIKQLHKALRSVQFLASFTSFYFEILSFLAFGEKIIRLASKNSVKLDQKSASDL